MKLAELAERAHARGAWWAPPLAIALHLAIGFSLYSSSGPDDVHITYGAAANLLHHGTITNYNGAPIEQSSSLAHVLLTALFARITGYSVVTVGHVLPIVAAALCLPLVYSLARAVVPRAPIATTLFVACIPQSVHWSFGGLEGPIFALATLLSVATVAAYLQRGGARPLAGLALSMTFMAMTRPEGMLVAVAAAAGLVAIALFRARVAGLPARELASEVKPELAVLGAAVVAALVTCEAHLSISGHPFPNPVLAKARGLALGDGLAYVWDSTPFTWWWAPVAFIAGVDGVVGRLRAPRFETAARTLVALFALAYLGFIVTGGGDWMWGGRFLANMAPLLGLLIVAGVVRALPAEMPLGTGAALAVALILANLPATRSVAGGSRTGRPAWVVDRMREMVAVRYPTADYGWFELASGVSLRDIPSAEALTEVIQRVAAVKAGPVVVASRVSGFTIFHTLEKLPPGVVVRFVDLESLATDDFIPCADAFLVRDTKGALLTPELLLRPPRELASRCKLPRPDIFFGPSHVPDLRAIQASGFNLVFRQRGKVGGEPWSAGHYSAYIAVERRLAEQAALAERLDDPLDFDWADTSVLLMHRPP